MNGRIVQVSISEGGVPKRPILLGLVTEEGVDGDRHAHPQFHGGPRQALLLIASEIIEDLKAAGWPLFPGALGENLTTEGLDYSQLRVGQRFAIGEIEIELTKLRKPCATLDVYGAGIQQQLYDARVKAGDATSPYWGRGGFYASVTRGGSVHPGDTIVQIR